MLFKVDENLPIEATQLLNEAGYDAMSIHDQQMVGASDSVIAAICQLENRIILTLDTDFADIRFYPPQEYAGIIVLRLLHHDKPHVLAILKRLLPMLRAESPEGQLWIVDEERIRVRV